MIAQARGSATGTELEIWPDCWDAVELFRGMATQWFVVADSGQLIRTGLNYASLPSVEDRLGIVPENRRQLFDDLRLMEAVALPILNKAKK